jgi:hypothetical protein
VAELDEINAWMAQRQQQRFNEAGFTDESVTALVH